MTPKILIISYIMVLLVGCNHLDGINEQANKYAQSSKISDANIALNIAYEILASDSLFARDYLYNDEQEAMHSIAINAFDKGHFDLFYKTLNLINTRPNSTQLEILASTYKGKSAELINKIAAWQIKNGEVYDGFRRIESLAVSNIKYANAVKFLLTFYGCTDSAKVWAELANSDYISYSEYHPGGTKYEPLPLELDNSQITKLRINLRKGNKPPIQENCPIHLYKK